MNPDIHHEVGRYESAEAAKHLLTPHAIAIELASGEVVVGGPRTEDPEQ